MEETRERETYLGLLGEFFAVRQSGLGLPSQAGTLLSVPLAGRHRPPSKAVLNRRRSEDSAMASETSIGVGGTRRAPTPGLRSARPSLPTLRGGTETSGGLESVKKNHQVAATWRHGRCRRFACCLAGTLSALRRCSCVRFQQDQPDRG